MDYADFDALTFDCYGTLIDWETGLLDAFRPILEAHELEAEPEDLLSRYARQEAAAEAGDYLPYREVLATAFMGVTRHYGVQPTQDEVERFSASVADWPAFPDSKRALEQLSKRFKLGVITNCDDDLFAASNEKLGIEFDWVVTAQQAKSYKPDEATFHYAFERIDVPRQRILHVAQSVYHDHVPANRIGLASVWIDRRHDRHGAGATPVAEAAPDATFPDMASFAAAATLPRSA